MIAIVLLIQAATPIPTTDGPLAAIGRQALPAKGCAAYLWSAAGDRRLVAMALGDPAQLRLAIDGKPTDFVRTTQRGEGGFGFAGVTQYRGGDVSATLDMTIATRADLSGGAAVPRGTLQVDRVGHDTVVLPVAGLIGCAPNTPAG